MLFARPALYAPGPFQIYCVHAYAARDRRTQMKLLISLILALPLLPRLCAAAQDAKVPRTEAKEVSFSVDGSFDRYGDSRDEQFGAGLDIDCASELKFRRSAFDWSLNLYYSYNRSETAGEASSANSAGLDLAKLMLVRWGGKELRTAKPYLLAGAELTRLKETDGEGAKSVSVFLSPTLGFGAEMKLTGHTSLKAEYRANLERGARRLSGVTLGVVYYFLGGTDEEN